MNKRKVEISQLKNLLKRKWANKDINGKKDNQYFEKKFSIFSKRNLTNENIYFSKIDTIIRSLHDGHLKFSPPEGFPQVRRYSGMIFSKVIKGHALVKCEYEKNCKNLKLPLMVKTINDESF